MKGLEPRIPLLRAILLIVLLGLTRGAEAQDPQRFTLSGHIRDAATGEALILANIMVPDLQTGTISNAYGYYALTLPAGRHLIRFSYLGYTTIDSTVDLRADVVRNVELEREVMVMTPVVVTAAREGAGNVRSSEVGTVRLNPRFTETVPVLFGEGDILKTIQLLPGVGTAVEGSTGFHVRGGGQDQNLILLDEAPVYSPSHLLGFFSVFNSDAINDLKLIKGAPGAEYGGRLSSVLDIRMKEGNQKRFAASGGIGLVASHLTLEGPLVRDRSSFMLSGRRTYADLFLKLSSDEDIRNTALYFYDWNIKVNHRLGERDRLFLSGYAGRDMLRFQEEFGLDWGNRTTTLRWNHLFNSRLFLNTSFIYSDFDYAFGVTASGDNVTVRSGIRDLDLKADFEYYLSPGRTLKFGAAGIRHTFYPGRIEVGGAGMFNHLEIPPRHALENALYLSHEWQASLRLNLTTGLRYSFFSALGPGTVYSYDEAGDVTAERTYRRGERMRTYHGPEPRLVLQYLLDEASSLKLAYARNRQYLHLLSNTAASTPFDTWQPCSTIVRPGISDQVSAGWYRDFAAGRYEASVEVYYKDLANQVDYKNGAWILLNEHAEAELVFGRGWSYGLELLLRKRTGRLTGWIGYTWSRTRRRFEALNGGAPFSPRHDRTHDLSTVASYRLNEGTTFSLTWVFATGEAVTFPSGRYRIDGQTVDLYTDRNGYRMPSYHRLDLGVTRRLYHKGRLEGDVTASLYNAYGRRNAYSIYFREQEDDPTRMEAVRLSLFSFFPSVTFSFSW